MKSLAKTHKDAHTLMVQIQQAKGQTSDGYIVFRGIYHSWADTSDQSRSPHYGPIHTSSITRACIYLPRIIDSHYQKCNLCYQLLHNEHFR